MEELGSVSKREVVPGDVAEGDIYKKEWWCLKVEERSYGTYTKGDFTWKGLAVHSRLTLGWIDSPPRQKDSQSVYLG